MDGISVAIISVSVTVLLVAAGALWRLANVVRDRPTSSHLDGKFLSIGKDIHDLQLEGAKQSVTLSSIEVTVARLARRAETQPVVNSRRNHNR